MGDSFLSLVMAEHNLTSAISPFLDRHLVLHLLDFLAQNEVFSKDDLLNAKSSLLANTGLVDLQTENYKALGQDPSEDHETRQKKVSENLTTLESKCSTLLAWIKDNTEELEKLKNE